MSIGVGWGATLYESLQTLAPRELENVQVISLLGGIVQARRYNPSEFAWQVARMVGADCYLLTAPAVVDSPQTRETLIEKCGLRDVLRRAERLDMAVLSVGTMAPDSTAFRFGLLSDEDRTALIRLGAVGDILFNFFDRDGPSRGSPDQQAGDVDPDRAAARRAEADDRIGRQREGRRAHGRHQAHRLQCADHQRGDGARAPDPKDVTC